MKGLIKILEEQIEEEVIQSTPSFQELYGRLWDKMLYNVCMKYTNDINQARDYCQNGWMKVFNKLDKFGGSGSPDGWVSVVIRNNILDELRKRKVDYADEEPEWGRLGKGSIEPESEDYEIETSEGITFDDVLQATQQLSPRYREVFELYLQGYKHDEIAEELGITVGTSKSNVFKSKKRIKDILST